MPDRAIVLEQARALLRKSQELAKQVQELKADVVTLEPNGNPWGAVDDLHDAVRSSDNTRHHLVRAVRDLEHRQRQGFEEGPIRAF